MATTFRAVFDGEVLRPEGPQALQPDATYVVTVEAEQPTVSEDEAEGETSAPYALSEIRRMAIHMGVDDLSTRHDWYAHGRLPDEAP